MAFKQAPIDQILGIDAIQEALWNAEGDVKEASIKLQCSPSAIYRHLEDFEESAKIRKKAKAYFVKQKVEQREKLLYSWQEQKKNAPVSFASIKYYLDTHGQEEGWGKKEDFTDEEVAVLRKLVENKIGPPPLPKE